MGNSLPPPPRLSLSDQHSVLSLDVSVRAIAEVLATRARRVVIMQGAGASTSAGIPDFRTPGTGLYDNLQKYNLPKPEAMFDIDFFLSNPAPFYDLARSLFPDNFTPTPTHFFVRLLQEKGVLLRCYTQNIDALERAAGVNPELLVEAHGSFGTAHCIKCREEYDPSYVRQCVNGEGEDGASPEGGAGEALVCRCRSCGGLVKPDIVFFGENLPGRFFQLREQDMAEADLLIVIGTSLKVYPFADLMNELNPRAPRLLLNMERVGEADLGPSLDHGFRFDHADNYRDAELLGAADDGVRLLCDLAGWRGELEELISAAGGSSLPPEV
eukprot:CAMPEP_0198440066 /NCGR_PEP_ID=MMETSP1452-20131203/57395_1 /TAXON_ID=1181717 /ORGANISM="Synchroma pusillum, Strain CCMP3072" /LENGTH=326 /DNA_ID=CAMNT_0044160681 /DNA_START=15 /DNA_END=992 /DNA_ORIENTATION=-